jgi:hypothetical protein
MFSQLWPRSIMDRKSTKSLDLESISWLRISGAHSHRPVMKEIWITSLEQGSRLNGNKPGSDPRARKP